MHRHHYPVEQLRRESVVGRMPAWVKMAVAVGVIVALVLVRPSWTVYGGVAAGLMGVLVVSRVSPWGFVKHLLFLEPFVLGVAIMVLARGGWGAFALVLARSTLCVATLILLTSTTPFTGMIEVLKAVRVPGLMVTTIALMYRYLSVMSDEARRMQRARASRTFTKGRGRAWHGMATVLSQLFVRASSRSERIYAAMCARGWR